MKRDPSRPKAEDIPDLDMLRAIAKYQDGRVFPVDQLPGWPPKVIVAKQRKLEARGFLKGWTLTPLGHEKLAGGA